MRNRQVDVNADTAVSRRGFLRGLAGGAAALGILCWSKCPSVFAHERRARGRSGIVPSMASEPRPLVTFDPKPPGQTQGPTEGVFWGRVPSVEFVLKK